MARFTPPADRPGRPAPVPDVIDLDAPARTRVVLDSGASPFERLAPEERQRLLIRVICELVAYDEDVPARTPLTSV